MDNIPLLTYLSSIIFLASFLVYFLLAFLKRRKLFQLFKEIPKSLIVINSALLIWRLFFIPHVYSSRSDYGVWLIGTAKSMTWSQLLGTKRAPVYFGIIKFFNHLLDGIGFNFMVCFDIFLFFSSVFFLFLLARSLFQNKTTAYATAIFYAFSPIYFYFSLTEDYTITAIFFAIQALFFAAFYRFNIQDKSFLLASMSSSILAAGSRPEYIFFPYLILVFFLVFNKKIKKYYYYLLGFFLFLIPRTLSSTSLFLKTAQSDTLVHHQTYPQKGGPIKYLFKVLGGHHKLFLDNLSRNIQAFLNLETLTGLFTLLSIISLLFFFKKRKKQTKKIIVFFLVFFVLVFLYYAYLHDEGFSSNFKYLSSAVLPLTILAGYGMGEIYKRYPSFSLMTVMAVVLFSASTLIAPLSFPNHIGQDTLEKYIPLSDPLKPEEEYLKYKNLNYDNLIFRTLHPNKKPDLNKDDSTYFITNGPRSLLYAMPLQADIIEITSNREFKNISEKLPKGSTIYMSQGQMGMLSTERSFNKYGYVPHTNPNKLKTEAMKRLKLEKKFISYYKTGLYVYLYKMKK